MKNIILIKIIFLTLTNLGNAQIQVNNYVGTWQFEHNNEVFEIVLWQDNNKVLGHYRKYIVDSNGTLQTELFNSNKEIENSGHNWPRVISAFYAQGDTILGGTIIDNTVTNAQNGRFIEGKFSIQRQSPTCNECPYTAIWKVTKTQDLEEYIVEHSVPTNCILTKVN